MTLTVNIIYSGEGTAARDFAREMTESGTVAKIREEAGNLRYDYFTPLADEHRILLIDEWESQAALDAHHKSEMMSVIAELREKYKLHMEVTRYKRL